MTDDDDLRARLHGADPAAGMAPIAPDRHTRLLEMTMTIATAAPRLNTRMLTLAAAALVLIAAVGGWFLTRPQDNSSGPGNVAAAPSPSSADQIVRITAPGIAAKCREPSAAMLEDSADFAFAGTVTSVYRDLVTLKVTQVYRGGPAVAVEVAQTGDISETMLGSGKFEIGQDYLVSSSEGSMLICGYSGEADSPGLRELFDAAF